MQTPIRFSIITHVAAWLLMLASAHAAELPPLSPVATPPAGTVRMSGAFGARYDGNIGYLLGRALEMNRLLFPFEHRDQWQRIMDWDGEYAGKWLDAAVHVAADTGHAELGAACDRLALRLRATEETDGYLGTELPANRLKPGWPLWMHWLAMKGLREHGQWRGDDASIRAAVRGADWLLATFSPITDEKNAMFRGDGVLAFLDEMAEVHAITGDARYLDFAAAAIEHYAPMRQLRTTGRALPMHAYNMLTWLGGAVRIAQARGDAEMLGWLASVWDDLAKNSLFPTASLTTEESVKEPPRDLPNAKLQETCATVEWLNFTHRLYAATGEVKYANMIERTVRNALLGAQRAARRAIVRWPRVDLLHAAAQSEGVV